MAVSQGKLPSRPSINHIEHRLKKDRRRCPTRAFSKYNVIGKRKNRRRKTDLKQIYVDWYGHGLLALLCAILTLCILDGYFTVFNVFFMGVSELNPVMAYFLNKNITSFFLIKYGLTAMGLVFLCVRINFAFIRSTLLAIFFLYVLVLGSHLYIVLFSPFPFS